MTQKQAVDDLIQTIQADYGSLNGIIHSAGVIRDNFILKKTNDEFREVLAPKVTGLVNLDQASKDCSLDFFILFSSVAGAFGNPGQADYATANAFMDAYARYRKALVAAKERQGQTLAINWPLWQAGGMHVDEATEKLMRQSTGMTAIQTTTGIRALYQALASGKDQVMVAEGNVARIKQRLQLTVPVASQPKETPVASPGMTEMDTGSLAEKVQTALLQNAASFLKVKSEDIDVDTELSEYGFDSIMFTEFVNNLNEKYKLELTPTIFFEYPTLHAFAHYLSKEDQANFADQFIVATKAISVVVEPESQAESQTEERIVTPRRHSRFARTMAINAVKPDTPEPIAIVGMSGTFPSARDLDEFWQNLVEGKDCISEIPKDRWDWREYYGDPQIEKNKTNVKWGGFIDGVAEFDPLFFGISPREALLMDPQQRLLMTYVWKAMEDAGYSAQSLWVVKPGFLLGREQVVIAAYSKG